MVTNGNARIIEQIENILTRPHGNTVESTRELKAPNTYSDIKLMKLKQEQFRGVKLRTYSIGNIWKHEFDHAGFVETSLMLAISDKVKMKKAKKGLVITKGLSLKEHTKNY